jgi:16S rRNA G966 N2-methylase RsmD
MIDENENISEEIKNAICADITHELIELLKKRIKNLPLSGTNSHCIMMNTIENFIVNAMVQSEFMFRDPDYESMMRKLEIVESQTRKNLKETWEYYEKQHDK